MADLELKMKILGLWYFVCFIFAYHSLDTLVDESHEVAYEQNNEAEPLQFYVCEWLTELLYPNQTMIALRKMRDKLIKSIGNLKKKDLEKHGLGKFKELALNRTRSGGHLIYNSAFCIIAYNETELREFYKINRIVSKAQVLLFATVGETFDFVQMKSVNDKIHRLTVLKKPHPYSDCGKSNRRFYCLNDCFKSRFKLSRYFHGGDETGLVRLSNNQSTKESEINCFRKCKTENCKMVQIISNEKNKDKLNVERFEAQSKLSELDYWTQLIGLVCSFAGLSIHELISIAIEYTLWKVKGRKMRIGLFYLKWVIFFLCLACCGYLGILTILDRKAEENNPPKKEMRNLIQQKIVHLAICVHIGEYVHHSYEEKTMSEIERATDGALNDHLEGIYTTYQARSYRARYQDHSKVLFKNRSRCFALSVRPYYPIIPSDPKLTINFKRDADLYLLSKNENLNNQSFKYDGSFAFKKKIAKKSRSSGKCVDYEEKYAGNCTGRQNCAERCIGMSFIGTNKITFGYDNYSVIDKDWFSPTEWNTIHPVEIKNDSIYENISKKCLQDTPDEIACDEIGFEETVEIKKSNPRSIEIGLEFDVVRSVEDSPSWYKLALNLLSIQSIFFGLTVLGSLQMVSSLFQGENKIVLLAIYLLCSIGASWHIYHILHLVISEDLVPTQHYEIAKKLEMPVMVFCQQFNFSLIDANYKVSGAYLEELTREMTTENMFANITYLNELNDLLPFDLNRVERFFYLNMRCYRIKIDQTYYHDQFYFSLTKQILQVNFSKASDEEIRSVYFMTKSKETGESSKVVSLNYECFPELKTWLPGYLITHETSLYVYEDRFGFIRKHFLSFPEEDASDLSRKLLELKNNDYNLRTLNIPMEENEYQFEFEEDLFEQLYSVEKNREKQGDWEKQHQQLFVTNHLRAFNESESDFVFILDFLQKIVCSTNEENFGKLVLSLINLLSIWFDLGVLDLHPVFVYFGSPSIIFGRISQFLHLNYNWLKKKKKLLYKLV